MFGVFLLFGSISAISAYTDVRADDVHVVTRKEWNDLKQELTKLKSQHQWEQLNKMKNDLDEIHALKYQLKDITHLNQQVKEIKLHLAELYDMRRQNKELKHRLTQMEEMEKELEEIKNLKKELTEVKQQLSDMKRLNQHSKEMNDLKQELKEVNELKQHLKELNKGKKGLVEVKQGLKEKNEQKEQGEETESSGKDFKYNSSKKNGFLMKTNKKNISEITAEKTPKRFNQIGASKVMFSNANNNASLSGNAESIQIPVYIPDESKKRVFKRLLHPPTTPIPIPSSLNQVAFCAELSQGVSNLGTHHTIVFDHVITNFGNAYNKNDGIFTAPMEGIYFFSWTTMAKPHLYQGTELVLDGQRVSRGWAAETDGYNSASKTVILHLQPGNEVWIRTDENTSGAHYLHNNGFNSFVGFLLK